MSSAKRGRFPHRPACYVGIVASKQYPSGCVNLPEGLLPRNLVESGPGGFRGSANLLAINRPKDKGRAPRLKAPPRSCDTHSHVYGPPDVNPHVPGRESRYAPVEAYRAMLSSPRKPASTIRIFSSAEYCLRVRRRMSRTVASAPAFKPFDFCLIFVPFGHYDEPETLRSENPSIYPIGADVRQSRRIRPAGGRCFRRLASNRNDGLR